MILKCVHFGLGTYNKERRNFKHTTNNPLTDLIYLNKVISNDLVNNISQTELQGEVNSTYTTKKVQTL